MASSNEYHGFLLTCVRHGETEANQFGLIQGQGVDSPLNRSGRSQSEKIGHRLASDEFGLIYSSDLKRSKETCEIILSKNKKPNNSNIVYDKRLRERCFGAMEGRYYHELRNFAFPSDDVEEDALPEGAESIKEVEKRAREFFNELCKTAFDQTKDRKGVINILLVSHGGFLGCLFNCFAKSYDCRFPVGVHPGEISVNTCRSLFEVIFNPETIKADDKNHQDAIGTKFQMECLSINDYSHLYKSV